MIPFNGFFHAAWTSEVYAMRSQDWYSRMEENYPQYVRDGELTEEGQYSEDPQFEAEKEAFKKEKEDLLKKSFYRKVPLRPGLLLQVKALPGGSLYPAYGDKVRTYILGGMQGGRVKDYDFADDDFVIAYKDLVSG